MNFKEKYILWLQTELTKYLKAGYSLKVLEEVTQAPYIVPKKNDIKIYVNFGVGSKQINTKNRINQPITITALSESDGFTITKKVLENFFNDFSNKLTILKNVEVLEEDEYKEYDFNVWHKYSTPATTKPYQQIGTESRTSILMTGIVSYSKGQILGSIYLLDGEYINLVDPTNTYQAETIAFNAINKENAMVFVESSPNTYSARFLLTNSIVSKKLLSMANNGFILEDGFKKKYEPILEVNYSTPNGTITTQVTCIVSHAQVETDPANFDNIINFVLVRKG